MTNQTLQSNKPISESVGPLTLAGIPQSLAPCFQEYDIEQLDLADHRELIIERVLAYGNRSELRWLFNRYGRMMIVDWVKRRGGRRLPWRRYNLWCVLFELAPPKRFRSKEQQIWPY